MLWFWLNMPLAAVFFGAWYGIPMWLIHTRPGWGSPPPAAPAPRQQARPAGRPAPAWLTTRRASGPGALTRPGR